MIKLKKINNNSFVLNAELIEVIEETPNTVITLTNGHKIIVQEKAEEVIEMVIDYKRKIHCNYINTYTEQL